MDVPAPDNQHTGTPGADGAAGKGGKRGLRWLLVLFLLIVLPAAGAAGWFAAYALRPGPVVDGPEATVFIPAGTSVEKIAALLDEAGLLHDDVRFLLLTRLLDASSRLPAGEFRLHTNRTPVELIRELVKAEPVQHKVTIAEGLTLEEIGTLFAAGGWVDQQRFVDLARDPALIAEFGLPPVASLEGYLFPDTYRLTRPSPGEKAIIDRLVRRALAVYQSLERGDSRLTRHETFTLASIVEKETGKAGERPLIASVFLNRLKRSMKLQSDPTVSYGIADFDGTLTRADLNRRTPYNTYQISGLPPGPISSPGRDSLQAVLTPAESKFLYFVSKNDGSHQFSTNLRDHNRAVQKYQR